MKDGPPGFKIPDLCHHSGTIHEHTKRWTGVREYFTATRVAVDAGAHVGFWSTVMAADFDVVHAFEPHPDNFACLLENVGIGGRVKCYPRALGLAEHAGEMHYHGNKRKADGYNSGTYHVKPGGACTVTVTTLDSLNLPICDFIKIDVEGMEHAVLLGALETIERCRPLILLECNNAASTNYGEDDDAAEDLLKELGYRKIDGWSRDHLYRLDTPFRSG